MEAAACAVGRLGEDGPWLGFAPALDDGYDLVVAGSAGTHRAPAMDDDLLCLAIVYFEDILMAPPDELAATHADIGSLVRHVANRQAGLPSRAEALIEAVDAIDDGLAGDAVIAALSRCLPQETDPVEWLVRRADEVTSAGA